MSTFWKSKVLPKLKKLVNKPAKKKGSADTNKAFDDQKEIILAQIEEQKVELQVKVVEIYKSATPEIQGLLKEPTEEGVKAKGIYVETLLERLVTAGVPGVQILSDGASKYGTSLLVGSITFLLQKTAVFVEGEPAPVVASKEVEASAPAADTTEAPVEAAPDPPVIEEVTPVEATTETVEAPPADSAPEAAPAPAPTPAPEATPESQPPAAT